MAYSNRMGKLLKKIERRLGTKVINLPEELNKDSWVEPIIEDTLPTFSRYYPHNVTYTVVPSRDASTKYPGMYHINEDLIAPDIDIYGVRDLDLNKLFNSKDGAASGLPNGYLDAFGYEDVLDIQMYANATSMYNSVVIPYYNPSHPHMVGIKTSMRVYNYNAIDPFDVILMVRHPDNLSTISPTKFDLLEKLAIADVKIYLYNALILFDNLETIFGTTDIKLDRFSNGEDEREALVNIMEEKYVSMDNDNQTTIISL